MKTTVFYMEIPDAAPLEDIYPKERADEINKVKNERAKREKYYAWKLLERACEAVGIDFYYLNFQKSECGKWTSDKLYFSLSHTDGAVAVALFDNNVGVDIEIVSRRAKNVAKKVFSQKETEAAEMLSEGEAELYFTRLWTEKESVFKTLGERVFSPNGISLTEYETASFEVELSGKKYVISVCCDGAENAQFLKI